ncbi:MAG: hypothetical protein WCO92_00175, partial [Verrucomicrobiota bacterium]
MGDFLSSATFRSGSSSLRRPRAQRERRQTEAGDLTTEQPRGKLGSHGIQEVQPAATAGAAGPPFPQDQMRQARVMFFSNSRQPASAVGAPGINHTVAQVSPPKKEETGFLSTLSSAATSLAQAVGLTARPPTEAEKAEQQAKVRESRIEKFFQPSAPSVQGNNSSRASSSNPSSSSSRAQSAAASSVEDDGTLAAKRFDQLDERKEQTGRINSSIDAYNTQRNGRAIAAAVAGREINNSEALEHNERMEQFAPLGRQFAKKAIAFTKTAMHLAEEGSALEQPALHSLARGYDDLAATSDKGVVDFQKRLSQENISDRDLNEVVGSYQQLGVQAESLEAIKNDAEKGIQFSRAAQSASSSASEIDKAVASVPYDRLAGYCFRIINRDQITAAEREHYDPMVDLASQSLKARAFGSEALATALEKNIQTHEAIASCIARKEQSSDPAVKNILSQSLQAHITAKSSRNEVIKEKRSELERTKTLTAATSDEEFARAELVNEQNEEYKKSAVQELQSSDSSSMRSASPVELMTNADAYEKVAHSFEQAATCQEAIHALPDIPSKAKSQKTFKERAQVFLEQAQKLHA